MTTPEPSSFVDFLFDTRNRRNPGWSTPPTGTSDGAPVEVADIDKYVAGALTRARSDLELLVEGGRNDGLNKVAYGLGRFVGADLLDEDVAAERLDEWTAELWTDRDPRNCRGTIRSGLRGGATSPLSYVVKTSEKAVGFTPPAVDDGPGGGWVPVDLSPYVDGSHEPVLPSLLRRTDDVAALYPGRVHWLSGEPESLKTWLALLAAYQQIVAGERVVYIDLEDSPAGMAERLLVLGLSADLIARGLTYISPTGPLTDAERLDLEATVRGASLLVIDAATEALSIEGLTPKDDVDIARWLELLPRWAARLGPAVLVIDHVVKDSDNRGRWATGSQHKLAGLDGIALLVEAVHAGGRGKKGRSRVLVAKDRHGHLGPHVVVGAGGKRHLGDLVVDGTTPFVDVALHPPEERVADFLPTVVMARVAEKLAAAGKPMRKYEIEDRVGGRAQVVRQAIAALVDAGYVTVTTGPANSRMHELVRPYPDEDQAA